MLIRSGARVALSVAMFLPLLASCGKDKPATGAGEGNSKPVPVTTVVVQPSAWSDTLQAIGTTKARESVTLTSKVSEVVQDVHFESGDEVRAGAPLITLRGAAQQASLVEAQATFAEADRLYRRQLALADQQLVARASLDTQKAIRDAAAARVQQTRSDIGDRNVRAPFAGVLGIRQVSPGALITPTTVIATLDDISRVYVDFPVPESQLANLADGQALRARSASYPGRDFEGVVSTIDARIDAATRAVIVRGDFPNDDRVLRPGMLMEVQLSRPERRGADRAGDRAGAGGSRHLRVPGQGRRQRRTAQGRSGRAQFGQGRDHAGHPGGRPHRGRWHRQVAGRAARSSTAQRAAGCRSRPRLQG